MATLEKSPYLRSFGRENLVKRKHSPEFDQAGTQVECPPIDSTRSAIVMARSVVHATRDVRPW